MPKLRDCINEIILPLKLVIPQPIIRKIPGLTTNEDIRISKALQNVRPEAKCLDIGCGNNKLIKRHRMRGGEGMGIDVYPWDGIDLIVEDSSKLPFEENGFDCVTFVASLNHIPNRAEVLKEAYRVLKDAGTVIITLLAPKISVFWHKIIYWDRDQNERGMKEGEVYGFVHSELCLLLEKAGFEFVKRKRFSWGLNNLYIFKK